ncbi:MAG TPA: BolA/IbaG family iron-sulfur metabolism protein [Chromatiales bacterium]|nr:BolA/IbaG family iron-sulfur metabolism protein [Chromatiales bacterium]
MTIEQTIERKLREALAPLHLEVVNESAMHNVPPGSESHFKVTVVTQAFAGQSLVARHRAVHSALTEELAGPVHALSIHAYTPEEWASRGQQVPASPRCRGGGKLQAQ